MLLVTKGIRLESEFGQGTQGHGTGVRGDVCLLVGHLRHTGKENDWDVEVRYRASLSLALLYFESDQ